MSVILLPATEGQTDRHDEVKIESSRTDTRVKVRQISDSVPIFRVILTA